MSWTRSTRSATSTATTTAGTPPESSHTEPHGATTHPPPTTPTTRTPKRPRRPAAPRPWWEQALRPTPLLEGVRNRQRAEAWRDGDGAGTPVYLRADIARALAEIAFADERPIEDVWLDDIADRVLAQGLGLDRGLPTEAEPSFEDSEVPVEGAEEGEESEDSPPDQPD